jgi:hypothetical protein
MKLPEQYLEIIYNNGFDNWESLQLLTPETFNELGIEDEFKQK